MLSLALVLSALADEPAPTTAPPAPALSEAERLEQFKERVVLFEDWVGVSASTGAVVSTWTVPKKGIYGEPLNGAKFYDYIGQAELASKYRKHMATSLGLRLGGLGLAAGGLALALTNISTDCEFVGTAIYPQADSAKEARSICREENAEKKPMQLAGYSLAGVGVVGLTVGLVIPIDPLKPHERKKLAMDFNKNLALELGIDLTKN